MTLQTSDGLALEADFYASGNAGGPGVVLLHMIPPHHDKSNYTPEFISALHEAGLTVLNVNRRGAGGSEGDAKAAYEGESGKLDAVAAHEFLVSSPCNVPAGSIAFVGASNGSTTALDYTVSADEASRPFSLVFLSPGTYTENQTKVADHQELLTSLPILFAYPDSEAQWPESIRSLDQGNWPFVQYDGGEHGTNLFQTHPESIQTVTGFLADHAPGA